MAAGEGEDFWAGLELEAELGVSLTAGPSGDDGDREVGEGGGRDAVAADNVGRGGGVGTAVDAEADDGALDHGNGDGVSGDAAEGGGVLKAAGDIEAGPPVGGGGGRGQEKAVEDNSERLRGSRVGRRDGGGRTKRQPES